MALELSPGLPVHCEAVMSSALTGPSDYSAGLSREFKIPDSVAKTQSTVGRQQSSPRNCQESLFPRAEGQRPPWRRPRPRQFATPAAPRRSYIKNSRAPRRLFCGTFEVSKVFSGYYPDRMTLGSTAEVTRIHPIQDRSFLRLDTFQLE